MTQFEVVETQTVRTVYRVEAESVDDARDRYDVYGEDFGFDILETLVSARPVDS